MGWSGLEAVRKPGPGQNGLDEAVLRLCKAVQSYADGGTSV